MKYRITKRVDAYKDVRFIVYRRKWVISPWRYCCIFKNMSDALEWVLEDRTNTIEKEEKKGELNLNVRVEISDGKTNVILEIIKVEHCFVLTNVI